MRSLSWLLCLILLACHTPSKKENDSSPNSNGNLDLVKYLGTKAIYTRPAQNEFTFPKFQQETRSCKPFFLVYLGRHGARGETYEEKLKKQIEDVKPFLQEFPEGTKYKEWLNAYYEQLKPYTDALTPLGKSQVEEIGSALYKHSPSFSNNITVAYTNRNRVIETRDAFLHPWQKNQSLLLNDETKAGLNLDILRFHKACPKYIANMKKLKKTAKNICAPLLEEKVFKQWAASKGLKNMDLAEITDGFKIIKTICSYQIAASPLASEQQFCSLVSKEALKNWNDYENCNNQIVKGGPSGLKYMNGISVRMADVLVDYIANKVEEAITKHINKDPSAPTALLMFAHAETLIPTLTQLNVRTKEEAWNAADISPMAANYKMIFYDCESLKESEKIQVYLSLNERPAMIAGAEQNKSTYNWQQINSYLSETASSTNFNTVCYNDETKPADSEIEED